MKILRRSRIIVKNHFRLLESAIVLGLLAANATFLACTSSDGSSSMTAGSSGTLAASGANQDRGGNGDTAGHSGAVELGGSAPGGANAGGATHGGSGAPSSGGMNSGSGGGGGVLPAAGSSNAGHGGSTGGAGTSNGGASTNAGSSGQEGHAGAGPTMSATQAIFDQHCTNCHDASKTGLSDYPALPLTSDVAYAALVSHPADESCGGTRVVPYDSTHSYLFRKVSDATPCSGVRMPHKPEVGPTSPLNATELETIRAWIDGGAHP